MQRVGGQAFLAEVEKGSREPLRVVHHGMTEGDSDCIVE